MKQILETMTSFWSYLAQFIFEAKVVEDAWNWRKQDWNQVPYLSEFQMRALWRNPTSLASLLK